LKDPVFLFKFETAQQFGKLILSKC